MILKEVCADKRHARQSDGHYVGMTKATLKGACLSVVIVTLRASVGTRAAIFDDFSRNRSHRQHAKRKSVFCGIVPYIYAYIRRLCSLTASKDLAVGSPTV
jgi:hypothetical protein